eukprot:364208-Chlamydomonas_euryale.AAC.2
MACDRSVGSSGDRPPCLPAWLPAYMHACQPVCMAACLQAWVPITLANAFRLPPVSDTLDTAGSRGPSASSAASATDGPSRRARAGPHRAGACGRRH